MMEQQLHHIRKSLFEPPRDQGESEGEDPTRDCGCDEDPGYMA